MPGLVKALNRFDPAVGDRFLAYAMPTMTDLRRQLRILSLKPDPLQSMAAAVADPLPELFEEILPGRSHRRGTGAESICERTSDAGKFTELTQPMFAVQILIRVVSEIPGRA
jgi:hypothetical protein